MTGQCRIADAHVGDPRKRGLKGGQQLCFELTVQPLPRKFIRHVAADVRVEQDRVADAVAVLSEAADVDVDVNARALIDHAERNGAGRAVFVADQLLGVEVVDALILGGFAAEGKALADVFERVEDALPELTGEDGRFSRAVIDELARLGAQLRDLTLIDEDHALPVGNGDDRAVRDDIFIALVVAAPPRHAVQPLDRQHALRDRLAVKILLPLVSQHAAGRTQCSFDKTHIVSPFLFVAGFVYVRRGICRAVLLYDGSLKIRPPRPPVRWTAAARRSDNRRGRCAVKTRTVSRRAARCPQR